MPMTVEQIIAEGHKRPKEPSSDIARCLKKLRKVDALLTRLVDAVRHDDEHDQDHDWELIYDVIFSRHEEDVGMRARAALEIGGYGFPDYCDPDTSYEADARAWIKALREKIASIESDHAIQVANASRVD